MALTIVKTKIYYVVHDNKLIFAPSEKLFFYLQENAIRVGVNASHKEYGTGRIIKNAEWKDRGKNKWPLDPFVKNLR